MSYPYTILVCRGLKADLPGSAPEGQLFETTDTHELYVGTGSGVTRVALIEATFVYAQVVAAMVWNIQHNLGKYPSVTIVDSGGNKVKGDVQYLDANNVKLSFSAPFAGNAYLN